MRKTFAVGRLTPDTTEIVLVGGDDGTERDRAPFPGPWSLKAVVRPRAPHLTTHATSRRVH